MYICLLNHQAVKFDGSQRFLAIGANALDEPAEFLALHIRSDCVAQLDFIAIVETMGNILVINNRLYIPENPF